MAKRPAELDTDLFRRSLNVIASGAAYLGDESVVTGLLALVAKHAMDVSQTSGPEDPVAAIERSARACADVFLGKDRRYMPVPKWNAKDGGIVGFLRLWCGVDEEKPEDVVTGSVLEMVSELFDVADLAAQDDVLDEEWQFQVTEVIERYSRLFLGVSLPNQAIFDRED